MDQTNRAERAVPLEEAEHAVRTERVARGVRAVRAVRTDEWAEAREFRLDALRDPAASIAFLETYEDAVRRPDSFWRERTERSARSASVRQFVAESADGGWAGSVVALVERRGTPGAIGGPSAYDQAHLVAVYVRPEHRGAGVLKELFDAATAWAWSLEEPRVERVRLYVDERNGRARAAYRKLGFEPSGESVPVDNDPSARELELAVSRPSA
ncbi:Mycothiol acetyltransferase [Streptomyces sp. S4.7]|uniref:GNAT family N-acetyltransferase n=1 Tax=Streptomyces sp. S4.7 TaxID=2705439 RepID=UPI001398485C|nr:N-acetyltransferase [Streptomyces sp. S4.7]QHY96507.1 Mycothiol acetyltransferase [Streptomyces sp. S4.7]